MKILIDPHVHLRDFHQIHKESIEHALDFAHRIGISGMFEMPNTNPALTSYTYIIKRIELANKAQEKIEARYHMQAPFHGLYAGITDNRAQICEVLDAYAAFFPRVVGLKMFAGHSTGNMGLVSYEQQAFVYQVLADEGYMGVLAIHCEQEHLLLSHKFDASKPWSHNEVRSPQAEYESIEQQLILAREKGFLGTIHICHITTVESIVLIESYRDRVAFKITCGVTPHHCLVSIFDMKKHVNPLLLKVNPPIRERETQTALLEALYDNRIDWIESDHAPHTINEKLYEYASGIPGLGAIRYLANCLLQNNYAATAAVCAQRVLDVFGIDETLFVQYDYDILDDTDSIFSEYPTDPYALLF